MPTSSDESAPTPARLAEAADLLERQAPGHLERVRTATSRLGARSGLRGDAHAALAELLEAATIDIDLPTMSARRTASLVKGAVKKLTAWELRYVGHQVSVLGQAASRLGDALVTRTDALERQLAALEARVVHLEASVRASSGSAEDNE